MRVEHVFEAYDIEMESVDPLLGIPARYIVEARIVLADDRTIFTLKRRLTLADSPEGAKWRAGEVAHLHQVWGQSGALVPYLQGHVRPTARGPMRAFTAPIAVAQRCTTALLERGRPAMWQEIAEWLDRLHE